MKVLHINCNYIGTTLHQKMIEHLDDLGVESHIFVPTYDAGLSVIRPNPNVCVAECFRKWDRIWFDYKQNKIFKRIRTEFDVSSFQCIHAYTLFTDGNCAMRLSKQYGVPYVVAVRNTDVNDFFKKMIHLRHRGIEIMEHASAIFFLSRSYQSEIFEKYVPQELQAELLSKTHIIPNGIDDFWFENAAQDRPDPPTPNGTVQLIYAGRIDRNKNIPTTQRAIDLLREKGMSVELTVIGKVQDSTEFAKIQKHPHTVCVPPAPKEELIRYYRQNHLFVMPSFTETFGLVYVEAMTQGLPVVYSQGQGFDCQFEEGEVGYHVSSHSPEEVAEAIERILESYEDISRRCVEGARRYKWPDIVQQYHMIYQHVVAGDYIGISFS